MRPRYHVRRASSAAASTSGGAGDATPAVVRSAGREQLEVVFLGTGAAIPAKYRNVSGIFVNLFAYGGIMLDCVESRGAHVMASACSTRLSLGRSLKAAARAATA